MSSLILGEVHTAAKRCNVIMAVMSPCEMSRKLSDDERRKLSLAVAALSTALRGQPGRNPGDNDDTTRHFSGRSVRVLAFGLAFMPLASRMIRLRLAYGGTGDTGTSRGEIPFQTHRTLASIFGSVFGLCYFLCYFWGRNLGPFRQSEKKHEPIEVIYYQWFVRMASDGVQRVETA